jgi:hypothetical protein
VAAQTIDDLPITRAGTACIATVAGKVDVQQPRRLAMTDKQV